MKYGLIISILLHSILLAIGSIAGSHNQLQQNKSERLIMVSIWENSDNKDIREKAKKINLHKTQRLDRAEAIKETSVSIANEENASAFGERTLPILTEASTYTPQTFPGVDGTLTVKASEDCVAGDIPSTGAQNFGAPPGQINTDNLLQEYICRVKAEIERKKNYPQIARRNGIEGVVRVQFCISNDGRLKGVTIAASSGCPILDNEAVSSVKEASPFSCIPEELKKEELELKVNITFRLEG